MKALLVLIALLLFVVSAYAQVPGEGGVVPPVPTMTATPMPTPPPNVTEAPRTRSFLPAPYPTIGACIMTLRMPPCS